jgi:hypothetical protein
VGSWACFALVIARLAFRVLPSPEIAGHLVRPVLNDLHWYGRGAGSRWLRSRSSAARRLLVALPLVLASRCLATQLGVTPRSRRSAISRSVPGETSRPRASTASCTALDGDLHASSCSARSRWSCSTSRRERTRSEFRLAKRGKHANFLG